ncbi:MAG: mannonate dehydratase [Acidobacteria bacterium]|nr:mannonate dehydratase [Acidobacteriota bacterium]
MQRRNFGKSFIGAAMAAGAAPAAATAAPTVNKPWGPGIKVTLQAGANPTDEDLRFVHQLGLKYVNFHLDAKDATLENFQRLKGKAESAGLKVWNIGHMGNRNMEEVTLNLPGRDKRIEEYKQYLKNMNKVGIRYVTYAHMANGIWSTDRETTRGPAPARAFNMAKGGKGYWGGKTYELPLTHGRVYSEQEIWDNWAYFIKQVAPVAEAENVFIGCHPDDPPVPMLGGIPRCIFGTFEGHKKALEIANSPNVGLCFCVGTWLEGGELMGADAVTAIKHFGSQGKIFKVHFRNMSASLPHFVETFVDNGYYDMYRAMKALVEVGFDGSLIGDHFPEMIGGPKVAVAYTMAWLRAMAQRAESEVGVKA